MAGYLSILVITIAGLSVNSDFPSVHCLPIMVCYSSLFADSPIWSAWLIHPVAWITAVAFFLLALAIFFRQLRKSNNSYSESGCSLRPDCSAEERFQCVLGHINGSASLLDSACRFTAVSDKFLERWKFAREDVVGRHMLDVFPGLENTEFSAAINRVMETGNSDTAVGYWNQNPGNQAWLEMEVYPVPDGVMTITANLIEKKKAEESLRASEVRYRSLVESQRDMIVAVDPEGRFTFVNDAYCGYFGLPREQLIGNSFHSIVHPDDIDNTVKAMEVLKVPPYRARIEQRAKTPTGYRWVEWEDSAIIDDNGDIVEILGVGRDTHERRSAEDALRDSEEQYRHLIESVSDPVCAFKKDGTVLFLNHKAAEPFRMSSGEMVGKKMQDLFPEPYGSRQLKAIGDVIEAGKGRTGITETVVGSGIRWYETRIEPLRLGDDTYNAALVIPRDITESREAEQKLRRQALIFDNIHDGIILTNPQGRIIDWNPSSQRIFGYTREEVIGESPEILNRPDQAQGITDRIRRDLQEKGRWAEEVVFVRKDGSEGLCEASVVPVNDKDDRMVATVAINRDVTNRRKDERKLKEHQKELARAARFSVLGEITTGLAHELNQPLSAIKNYIQGCLRRMENNPAIAEELRQAMQNATLQADRAGRIIRRARHLVRQEPCDPTIANINIVIMTVITFDEIERRYRDGAISLELTEKLPKVCVDTNQIEQILVNLIQNGFEAMHGNEPEDQKLVVRTRKLDDSKVVVDVIDRGVGLVGKTEEGVFAPFYTTKEHGLGMGLPICRSSVEQHGGRLWFENNPDGGVTFSFSIPAVREKQ